MGVRSSMRSPLPVLSILVFLLEILQVIALARNQTRSNIPAVIVFGDSIVDPGNNNAIVTMVKCNFPPYGKDFVEHKSTGRFSNGKVPSDLIASRLGIKEYVPPYLGTELDAEDLLTGVSFASGGNGYDPLTSALVSVLSMDDQLRLFEEYIEKLKVIAGEERAASIISRSLYMVVTGTDDIANTYFTTPFRREFDLQSYINFVVQQASIFFKKLYNLGARKIGVVGAPPIGCVPSQRTLAGGIERVCVDLYNQAAQMMNTQLSNELQRLNHTLPNLNIVYIDLFTPLSDMILHPYKYGFEETSKGCCGTGIFEATLTCNSITTHACEDASKYLFWDAFHLTERGYIILNNRMFQQHGAFLS